MVDVDRLYWRLPQFAHQREFNGPLSLRLIVLAVRRTLASRHRFPNACLALEYLRVVETLDYLGRNHRHPIDTLPLGRATYVDRNLSQWPSPQKQTDRKGSSSNTYECLIEFLTGDHEYRQGTISLSDVVHTQRIARRDGIFGVDDDRNIGPHTENRLNLSLERLKRICWIPVP